MTLEEVRKELVPGIGLTRDQILADYRTGWQSRHASVIGRREVLSGKAKFGIFGDGKELPQLAMAHVVRPGDIRAGYYRDQTLMFATQTLSIQAYFAQLYAHPDIEHDPATGGRSMNAHFGTRLLDAQGEWIDHLASFNSTTDVSPTASQMPRLVGLAYASRLYRNLPELASFTRFSDHGNEVAFGTIGNASTAEGLFWESVNAVGVLQSPAVITIYDDGYGISVTNEHQMVKEDLSALLLGFCRTETNPEGFDLHTVRAWDYPALLQAYQQAAQTAREEHIPQLIHVIDVTQPQGHSTSGSHERYKSPERLRYEVEFDCLRRMRSWILEQDIASEAELDNIEAEANKTAEDARKAAWEAVNAPMLAERDQLLGLLRDLNASSGGALTEIVDSVRTHPGLLRRDMAQAAQRALLATRGQQGPQRMALNAWREELHANMRNRYCSHLHSQSETAALKVQPIPAVYAADSPLVPGYDVMNACFDAMLAREPRLIAFGEDVGQLGDVNQGFKGLQEKYGKLRVTDTGIREATILGQAIGMAMRGLRPLAEIQYLDYLLYALQLLSDDLATLQWRTVGGQKAPVILRTRGHRLEGIWHSGSPMAGIINLVRGVWVCVPRNMTQAAGFYNTILASDDAAIIVEVLNGYRIKERLPANIAEFRLPLGVPEVIRSGKDLTLVTYGACCRLASQAADMLAEVGADIEIIDVQTLLPFDLPGVIGQSLQKTGRLLLLDEDVPGGATAYMLQEILEKQNGYHWLDSAPRTLSAREHRPAYGSDGDYWSKPNVESIFEHAYALLHEADPARFPTLY